MDGALRERRLRGEPLPADAHGRRTVPQVVGGRAVPHVKPDPYYVSDATTADVVDTLRRLTAASGAAAADGHRLWSAMTDGRPEARSHPFSSSPFLRTEQEWA